METVNQVFTNLSSVDVSQHIEQKNGLNYLSWAWAWSSLKSVYPTAQYIVYENTLPNGYVVNYFTDGMTSYVKVGIVIEGLEHIEMLPVMDFKNKSIRLDNMTSFDVNKAIQRCLTKAIARHGLGLNIYSGEDLPDDEQKPTCSQEVLNEALANRVDINKLAAYYKKRVNEITDDDLLRAIQMKKQSSKGVNA